MFKRLHIVATVLLALALVGPAFSQIPSTAGWYEIPNTKLRAVCADSQCPNVVAAWSGAAFDTLRNRMLVWGGGHNDYFGNEIYALNLNGTPSVERITVPCYSPDGFNEVCTGSNPPQPQSRHSYGFVEYIPGADRLLAGTYAWDTQSEWTFDFAGGTGWHEMFASGTRPTYGIESSMTYDPVTGKVYDEDFGSNFFGVYSYSTNSWQKLGTLWSAVGYSNSTVLDPIRRKVFSFGGGNSGVYDISGNGTYDRQNLTTTGGAAIVAASNPGLAYDPTSGLIVAWAGGDSVYIFNPDTSAWTTQTFAGGPGAQQANGTFGRWRYVPALRVFVLVNSIDQNAYALRLNGASGPAPDTQAPTVAITRP